MKPAAFDYTAPDSLEETLAVLGEHADDAKLLAGGQSLVPMMNFRLAQPAMIIDCNRLRDLDFVRQTDDGGLRIGAMTRVRSLERDLKVERSAPLLFETVPWVAHPQIRARGTLGGSLAHADPAAELPVVALARRFRLRLRHTGSERWVDAKDFFVGLLETTLEPREMLVEVAVPPLPRRTGWAFTEVARRQGDYAQVGVAALVTLGDGGSCRDARLVYLSVGETPIEASRAALSLVGESLDEESFAAAAETAAGSEIEPTSDIHASAAYKRHLARVLTVRALRRATERAWAADGGAR
ncbi:MAG: xanthine dehydrogenase family protein subunit M [bacterium]|nr:xanthine dehydrogenase family protein subunit M [bacterium]